MINMDLVKKMTWLSEDGQKEGQNGECLIGFDGYIDEMFSVVENRSNPEHFTRYKTIEDFGQRIVSAAGQSADIEIYPIKAKFGGNAPILSNALAVLGYKTTCAGQMDCDNGEDFFAQMHLSCQRISVGPVNRTIALEFSDGKIMLGNLRGSSTGWEEIKNKVGQNRLSQLIKDSKLIGIVNWSGMFCMNEIINGMFQEYLLPLDMDEKESKDIFFDLADPTARSKEDREELFALIRSISTVFRVTLGMNENEAIKIGKSIGFESHNPDETGEAIRKKLGVYQVVIHTNKMVLGLREHQVDKVDNLLVKNPVATTGAGDHFNAGFCMGILENKSLEECMMLGQSVASYYISNGVAPQRKQLMDYILNYINEEGKSNE